MAPGVWSEGSDDLAARGEPERIGEACEPQAGPEGAVGAVSRHERRVRGVFEHVVEERFAGVVARHA